MKQLKVITNIKKECKCKYHLPSVSKNMPNKISAGSFHWFFKVSSIKAFSSSLCMLIMSAPEIILGRGSQHVLQSNENHMKHIHIIHYYTTYIFVVLWSLSRVQPFASPWISLPGFSVHGTFEARILEWVAISFSKGYSQPRDWTHISCLLHYRWILYHWAIWEAPHILLYPFFFFFK